MNSFTQRIFNSTKSALPKALRTSWWLLKLILPISLLVSLLQYAGIIDLWAVYLSPVFALIGLPGESAIVFLSSIFLPLYAPIAIIATLNMEIREITILALMCLITHNMFVETAIQHKTGSSYPIIFLLRIAMSFIGAALLNTLLPDTIGTNTATTTANTPTNISEMLSYWLTDASILTLKIVVIIVGLMILQNILKEFKIFVLLSAALSPVMTFLGLPKQSAFLWLIAQTLGLTYGAAVLIQEVENKEISREDARLLNYHTAINHSMLEDTLLFVAIGVPVLWIIFPRIILAFVTVWIVRQWSQLKKTKKSNKKLTQSLPI